MRKLLPFLFVLFMVSILLQQVSGENVTINATAEFNPDLGHGYIIQIDRDLTPELGHGYVVDVDSDLTPTVGHGYIIQIDRDLTPELGHGILVPVIWNNTITQTGGNDTHKLLDYFFGFHVDFEVKELNVSVSKNIINIRVVVDRHGFTTKNPELVIYVNNTPVFEKVINSFPSTVEFVYIAMERGNFEVKAVIDPNNEIREYDETNNVKTWTAKVTAQFIYEVIAKASIIIHAKGGEGGTLSQFFNLLKFWPGGDIGIHFMKLDVDGALRAFFNNQTIPFLGVMVFLLIWGGGVVMAWAYSKEPEFVAIWGLILYLGFKDFITVDSYLTLVDSVMVPFAFIISMMYLKKIFDTFGGG